jgi:hypothetical protein
MILPDSATMNWSGGGTGSNPVWAFEGGLNTWNRLETVGQACRECRVRAGGDTPTRKMSSLTLP